MKKILNAILACIATISIIVGFVIPSVNVFASSTTYTGLKLPFVADSSYYVANTHNVNPDDGRNAVDIGKVGPGGKLESFAVLAMHDGKIQLSKDPNNGILMIDHQDGYCSLYHHLELGTYPKDEIGIPYADGDVVKQGNQIAIAGATNADNIIHLHVVVISKKGNPRCPTYEPTTDEIRMIFDQIGEAPVLTGPSRPVQNGLKVTSETSDVSLVHRPDHLIRPKTGRPSIEFFDRPYSPTAGAIPLGTIKSGGLCKVISGLPKTTDYISLKVECYPPSIEKAYNNFDMRNGVWVNNADIEEVTSLSFPDIQFPNNFFADIGLVQYLGIFHGYSNGNFGYGESMKRGDIALTIYRSITGNEPTCQAIEQEVNSDTGSCEGSPNPTFYDVTTFNEKTEPRNIAIQWLANQDPPVVSGTTQNCLDGQTCFFPERAITKSEFTKIAISSFRTTNVYKQITIPECKLEFTDVSPDNKFKSYIDEACGLGFFQGYNRDGKLVFGVDDNLLREHAAKLLWRVYYELSSPRVIPADLSKLTASLETNVRTTSLLDVTSNGYIDDPDFQASQEVLDLRWDLMSSNRGNSRDFCQLYIAGNDKNPKNSMIGTFDLGNNKNQFKVFGPLHKNIKFQSFDIDPLTKQFYAVADGQGNKGSSLFLVDPNFGMTRSLGVIRYASGVPVMGLDSLSFFANGQLYGYVNKGKPEMRGIISINTQTNRAKLVAQFKPAAGPLVTGIAQEPKTGRLWLAAQKHFYSWESGRVIKKEFSLPRLQGIVGALEFLPNGILLAGVQTKNKLIIYVIDVNNGTILNAINSNGTPLAGISGLAFPSWCKTGY